MPRIFLLEAVHNRIKKVSNLVDMQPAWWLRISFFLNLWWGEGCHWWSQKSCCHPSSLHCHALVPDVVLEHKPSLSPESKAGAIRKDIFDFGKEAEVHEKEVEGDCKHKHKKQLMRHPAPKRPRLLMALPI